MPGMHDACRCCKLADRMHYHLARHSKLLTACWSLQTEHTVAAHGIPHRLFRRHSSLHPQNSAQEAQGKTFEEAKVHTTEELPSGRKVRTLNVPQTTPKRTIDDLPEVCPAKTTVFATVHLGTLGLLNPTDAGYRES